MSDRDAAPDPMDRVYKDAEAMLDDDAARAARRARVLDAVAREAEAPKPTVTPTVRRAWTGGRWLAAACVGGLGLLVAVRLYPPVVIQHQPPPPVAAPPPVKAEATPAPTAAAPVAKIAPASPPSSPAPAATATARAAPPPEPRVEPSLPAPPAPPPPPVQSEAAAPAAPAATGAADQVVVTATRMAPTAAGRAIRVLPSSDAEQLRAAAAAGRVDEIEALLKRKTPVDAADEDGETALMKAVQQQQPAAAALLRRHGADLDRKNKAGQSARDMAAPIGDAALDKALGLAR